MPITKAGHRAHHLLALAIVLCASHLLAAGFALYETSARSVALGGATLGSSQGAATIYDNPAGMTELPGSTLDVGLSIIHPTMDIDVMTPAGKKRYSPDEKWFPPPFAYYTQQMSDELWLGVGLYSPYGLGVEHDADWPGRYNSVKTLITAFDVNPNIAYKVTDRLSLAAGLQIMYFDIELTRSIPDVPYQMKLTGDSVGFGGNAALAYKIRDDLVLGLIYRSEVKQSVEGDAKVGPLQTTDAEGDITLPASYSAGLNYTGVEKWNFGAVATYTEWSSYDELVMSFNPPLLGKIPQSTSEKDWSNVWRFGLGVEYQATPQLSLQGGYVYDKDPINVKEHADYLLPPGDRQIISLGAAYTMASNWKVSLAVAYLMLKDVTIAARPQEGVLPTEFKNGDTLILSMSLAHNF